ncbi:MAG TPA: hypothetical protein VKB57_18260 [Acidimicrobiales bacterium]|nr:hypothetical protein [Acidimicrobiales bacterium]
MPGASAGACDPGRHGRDRDDDVPAARRADEDAFLAADKALQSDFAYQQPGLVRRTTARGQGERAGEWVVIDLWARPEDADACAARWDGDPAARAFMAFVDGGTVEVRRYRDLD